MTALRGAGRVNSKLTGVFVMRAFSKILTGTAVALALGAIAAPSQATTILFSSFDTGHSNSNNVTFLNGAADGTSNDATVFTTATANSHSAGASAVRVSFFDDPALPSFFDLDALFTLNGTVTDTAASCAGPTCIQTAINGSFDFIYNGPTQTLDGVNLVQGVTSLFSGTFTNAWIQGFSGVGGLDVTIGNGGHATFSSSIYDFSRLRPGSEEFSLHFGTADIHQVSATAALDTFSAHAGGDFQFDAVPEPGTWALMIVGFGGAGAMLRSRRRALATTA